MKSKFFFGLFVIILSTSLAYSQDLFMYGENGTKIYFNKIDSIVIVKFKKKYE